MEEKYAVVTGASSGIGKAFARQLAREGYHLVLVARRRERLMELSRELKDRGTESVVFAADLSQMSECHRLMEALSDKFLGIFINNAGFGDCGCFLETDEEKELGMIDVNVKAVHLLTKLVLRQMEKQGEGFLLNVASSAGLIPAGPYMAAYYATKSYVASLTRAVAQELKEKGSRVYIGVLCPGPVNTEFNSIANVEFSLPGISAEDCVAYAVKMMKKRKVVIIPTFRMKAAIFAIRMIPHSLYIRVTGHQQKKKLGRV
ncbi:MAG: SDR family NAD(P)-dependent oxidoreductase [Agathobacter sp.]